MNDQNESKPVEPKPKSKKWLKALIAAIIIALLVACGILGWIVYKNYGKTCNESTTTQQTATNGDTSTNSPTILPVANASEYSAQVGKFRLVLPDYVIIRQHDGGFEGGPITKLSIGTKLANTATNTNVIDYPTLSRVDISAQPLNGTYQDFITSYINSLGAPSSTEQANITVAGETARVFTVDGLFTQKIVFFQHSGIVYKLEAIQIAQPTDAAQKMLDAVISNFNFTV